MFIRKKNWWTNGRVAPNLQWTLCIVIWRGYRKWSGNCPHRGFDIEHQWFLGLLAEQSLEQTDGLHHISGESWGGFCQGNQQVHCPRNSTVMQNFDIVFHCCYSENLLNKQISGLRFSIRNLHLCECEPWMTGGCRSKLRLTSPGQSWSNAFFVPSVNNLLNKQSSCTIFRIKFV